MSKIIFTTVALTIAWANVASTIGQIQAEDGLIGRRVVAKHRDFALRETGEPVEGAGQTIDAYRVEQVDEKSLLLRAENHRYSGWAPSNDVVPIERALDYFSAQIRAHAGDSFLHAMRAFVWRDKSE